MIDENIFQLDEFQTEISSEEYNGKTKKSSNKTYLNNKNINENKKTSLKSKSIADNQDEQASRIQKRMQPIEDDSELSIKRIKTSSSSKIEEVIERIDKKLNDMHKTVDMIINIRNSILGDI